MKPRNTGFTLIEIMVVVAIIAALGAIAVVSYDYYTNRARAADIVESYESVRNQVAAVITDSNGLSCDDLAKRVGRKNLSQNHATLDLGYEPVGDAQKQLFRPVLTVNAKADGAGNIKAAASALETLRKTGNVEKVVVDTASQVVFAVALSAQDQPLCTKATPIVAAAAQVVPGATPKSQADCQPHQHFVAGMGCNNVCNPGFYFVPGPPASCSQTPPSVPAQAPAQPAAQAPAPVTGQFSNRMDNKIGSAQSWLYSAGIRDSWTGRASIVNMTVDPPDMATAAKADSGRWGLTFGSRTGPFTITMTLANVPPGNETVILKGTH